MTGLAWLLPGLPTVAGAGLLLSGRRGDAAAPSVGVVAAALTALAAIAAATTRPSASAPFLAGLPVELAVDDLSALLVVTVALVSLAVLAYAVAEIGRGESRARFFGLMLLFTGAMLVTVTATSLLPLLMAWEVMGATSYALIGFWWREPWRVRAATTAFVTTRIADVGLYLAAGAAFAGLGDLALDRFAALPSPWLHVVAAGVLVAAAGKSAQLPFSYWLSGAMAGPSSVSALLHSAAMVAAGGYLLLRLSPVLHAAGWAALAAAVLGAATAIVLGAVACVQTELKQVLAASTCAQVGFLVLAAGAGSVAGGAVHLAGHAAVKALLFLAAGVWLSVLGTEHLTGLRGAARQTPLVGGTAAIGGLTLAGVPPLTLWLTKDLALHGAPAAVWLAALVATALSAVYAGRIVFILFQRPQPSAPAPGKPVPVTMRVVLTALAVAVLLPVGLDRLPPVPPVAAAGSGLTALVALGLAWRWTRAGAPTPQRAALDGQRWLGLEGLAHRVVARPTLRLASALARFDDRAVARSVTGVAATVSRGATAVGRFDDRVLGLAVTRSAPATRWVAAAVRDVPERAVTGVVHGVAEGSRLLGRAARRPQTGQLHHYYAQAAVGFGLLAAVVVVLVVW